MILRRTLLTVVEPKPASNFRVFDTVLASSSSPWARSSMMGLDPWLIRGVDKMYGERAARIAPTPNTYGYVTVTVHLQHTKQVLEI